MSTLLDVTEEGDGSCDHKMIPDDTYKLPNPDIRNLIRVKTCENCSREEHHGTPIGGQPIDERYYE